MWQSTFSCHQATGESAVPTHCHRVVPGLHTGTGHLLAILGNSKSSTWVKSTTLAYKKDRRLDLRCPWGVVSKGKQCVSEHSTIFKSLGSPLKTRGAGKGGVWETAGEGNRWNCRKTPIWVMCIWVYIILFYFCIYLTIFIWKTV